MLIHVKKAFSQEDRAGGKAVVLHSYGLMCTHFPDNESKILMSRFALQDERKKKRIKKRHIVFSLHLNCILLNFLFKNTSKVHWK